MGGVITFFFPNRKNYWTLTIKSLGINFEISQYLLIFHLKKYLQKIRRNTNKEHKKFVREMNLTIRFFTPKNVAINLNTINYLLLWPQKKLWKIIRFFFLNLFRDPQSWRFFGCVTPLGHQANVQGVVCWTPIIFYSKHNIRRK